jgi:hypothetical protein
VARGVGSRGEEIVIFEFIPLHFRWSRTRESAFAVDIQVDMNN